MVQQAQALRDPGEGGGAPDTGTDAEAGLQAAASAAAGFNSFASQVETVKTKIDDQLKAVESKAALAKWEIFSARQHAIAEILGVKSRALAEIRAATGQPRNADNPNFQGRIRQEPE